MKYKTIELYGIDPKDLSDLSYKNALVMCKHKAMAHKANLVHDKQCVSEWDKDKEALIKYLSKTISLCEEKIGEME